MQRQAWTTVAPRNKWLPTLSNGKEKKISSQQSITTTKYWKEDYSPSSKTKQEISHYWKSWHIIHDFSKWCISCMEDNRPYPRIKTDLLTKKREVMLQCWLICFPSSFLISFNQVILSFIPSHRMTTSNKMDTQDLLLYGTSAIHWVEQWNSR